jgi:hypothetical protein
VAWVVPTYKNARAPWRFIERALGSVRKRVNINKTERLIDFPSGGLLGIYSGDNDTAIRGEAFDVVVVDEAAMIGEQTYTDVIQPTVADQRRRDCSHLHTEAAQLVLARVCQRAGRR